MMTFMSRGARFFLAATCLSMTLLSSAAFADPEIVRAIGETTQEELDRLDDILKQSDSKIDSNFESLKKGLVALEAKEQARQTKSAPIYELFTVLSKLPESIALTHEVAREVLSTRRLVLQKVERPDDRPDYLVDTSLESGVDAQSYDIFMRYFCNPEGRGGTLANVTSRKVDRPYNGSLINYTLGCGRATGAAIPSRTSILGGDAHVGIEAAQIIDLPTRPEILIFGAGTFPTRFGDVAAINAPISNANRASQLYLGAFEQFLLSVAGSPPDRPGSSARLAGDPSGYLASQRDVTVKMLASYPFALLFAERTGTMGPDVIAHTVNMLKTSLSMGTQSKQIADQIASLSKRQTISMAEYMDIMAYQLPTSPGYYARINNDLTPEELKREAVWLTSIQTALNYQRNRWLEILAALEAVDQR